MFVKRYGYGSRAFLGIHGWCGKHRDFEPLLTAPPVDSSFFSIDLPGCGASPAPMEWSLQEIVDEIAEAARSLPSTFTLIGHCSGALLGMLVAKRMPQNVDRLVLIDLFASYPWYFRVFTLPLLGPVAYYSAFANPIGRWLADCSLREHRTEDSTLTGGFSQVSHANTYRYLKLFEHYPAPETFADLRMPVDLVYGANSFRAILDSVPRWRTVWPQSRVWPLANAGHLPIQEAPGQLADIIFQEGLLSDECLIPSSITAA